MILTDWDLNKIEHWATQGVSPTPEDTQILVRELRAARAELAQHAALVAASQRFAEAITMDEMEDAHSALIAAALAVQPDASVARGEGEGT
jgi:hypothetical protein